MEALERALALLRESLGVPAPVRDLAVVEELDAWFAGAPLPLTIPWFAEDLQLCSGAELSGAQVGYATWTDGRREPKWRSNWTVIGNASGDAIVADTSAAGVPVYYAPHGMGSWKLDLFAPSLAAFAHALSIWVRVVGKREAANEDGLRPEVATTIHSEIAPIVGPEATLVWLGKHWLD